MFKKIALAALFMLATTLNAHAVQGHKKGKIKHFRVHDAKEYPTNWAPPVFWFTLEGVTEAGNCPKWNGNVLFVMESQMAFSIVMAYQLAGKEVAVFFDDSKLNADNFWCRAIFITGGDQVPLY